MDPLLTPGPEEGGGDASESGPVSPDVSSISPFSENREALGPSENEGGVPPPFPLGLTFSLAVLTLLSCLLVGMILGTALYLVHIRGAVPAMIAGMAARIVGIAVGFRAFLLLQKVSGRSLREFGLPPSRELWAKVRQGVGIYFLALPGYLLFSMLTMALSQHYGIKIEQKSIQMLVDQVVGHPLSVALFFLLAAVAAPVWEELIFRGLLYPAVRSRWGMAAGMLVTAFLFALMHETGRVIHDPRTFLFPIFYLGCVLAYVRERTGSVAPGIAVHALHNIIALTMTLAFRQPV